MCFILNLSEEDKRLVRVFCFKLPAYLLNFCANLLFGFEIQSQNAIFAQIFSE